LSFSTFNITDVIVTLRKNDTNLTLVLKRQFLHKYLLFNYNHGGDATAPSRDEYSY